MSLLRATTRRTETTTDPRDAEIEDLTAQLAQEKAQHAGTKRAHAETFEQAEADKLANIRLESLNQVLQTALLNAQGTADDLVRAEGVARRLLERVSELTAEVAALKAGAAEPVGVAA